MTAKELLLSLRTEENRIRMIEEEITDIHSRIESVRSPDYSKDRIQTSRTEDELANYSGQMEELEVRLIRASADFVQKRSAIYDLILTLTNPNHQRILELRYIKNMTFEQISCEMGYTFRHTTRLHGYALAEIGKKMS